MASNHRPLLSADESSDNSDVASDNESGQESEGEYETTAHKLDDESDLEGNDVYAPLSGGSAKAEAAANGIHKKIVRKGKGNTARVSLIDGFKERTHDGGIRVGTVIINRQARFKVTYLDKNFRLCDAKQSSERGALHPDINVPGFWPGCVMFAHAIDAEGKLLTTDDSMTSVDNKHTQCFAATRQGQPIRLAHQICKQFMNDFVASKINPDRVKHNLRQFQGFQEYARASHWIEQRNMQNGRPDAPMFPWPLYHSEMKRLEQNAAGNRSRGGAAADKPTTAAASAARPLGRTPPRRPMPIPPNVVDVFADEHLAELRSNLEQCDVSQRVMLAEKMYSEYVEIFKTTEEWALAGKKRKRAALFALYSLVFTPQGKAKWHAFMEELRKAQREQTEAVQFNDPSMVSDEDRKSDDSDDEDEDEKPSKRKKRSKYKSADEDDEPPKKKKKKNKRKKHDSDDDESDSESSTKKKKKHKKHVSDEDEKPKKKHKKKPSKESDDEEEPKHKKHDSDDEDEKPKKKHKKKHKKHASSDEESEHEMEIDV